MEPPRVASGPSRQRWRLVFRRRPDAPPLAQREWIAAWEEALARSGLPLAGSDRSPSRPRLSFGAPLAVGIPAERELVDLFLTEQRPAHAIREALRRSLPDGHEIVDLYDVWVGAPPLPGTVVALTYRATVVRADGGSIDGEDLASAAADLLTATSLPRRRAKAGDTVAYDLRPLLLGVEVAEVGPPAVLRIRVRVDPERGIGRPEEVVAALGDRVGLALDGRDLVRERVDTGDR